jgi:hypothetical protein
LKNNIRRRERRKLSWEDQFDPLVVQLKKRKFYCQRKQIKGKNYNGNKSFCLKALSGNN